MSLVEQIEQLKLEVASTQLNSADEVEAFRVKYLGRKGILNDLFEAFKAVPNEEKKAVGAVMNGLKTSVQEKIDEGSVQFKSNKGDVEVPDFTRPYGEWTHGSRHPLQLVREEILSIFERMGFSVEDGPEIEDDWHVFSGLNFSPEHPARDMQDTFFVEKEMALRTHTSSVQVRVMQNQKPPIRTISPGRVYRNEAVSARANCFFHQVEGLYINKNVSFADLKQTLLYFSQEMFGADTKIRLRPSYFPFTEPSAEMDISCTICKGKGCNICKYTGWVEILGCGMIDPAVLENNKIDSKKYSGFAFGMGIERITMLKYSIKDLRIFSENDVRFLDQFKGVR